MNLTCTTPPDPPPNIPKLEDKGSVDTANVRAVLEAHRANPACAACHALFDPFGLALEQYDGIGKFRTMYANGTAIDPSTDLAGTKFSGIEGGNGLPGVADIVTQDPKFGTCISQKMLQYGLGRVLTDTDTPYLDLVNKEWLKAGATPSIAGLVKGLVSTETFKSRRGEGT